MFEQAKLLRADGRLHPVMILATDAMAEKAQACRDAQIGYVEVTGEIEAQLPPKGLMGGVLLERIERWCQKHEWLGSRLPLCLVRAAHLRRRLRAEYAVFSAVCRRIAPAAIIVPGDRELSPVPALLRAALDLGIPTIIGFSGVPYRGGGVEFARASSNRFRVAWRDLPPLLNVIAARRHPGQRCNTPYGARLFSPGWLVLVLAELGMLSANPWVQGGGNTRYVLQHNRRWMDHFETLGVSRDKLVLIGDPELDGLYKACREGGAIRSQFLPQLTLDSGKALAVVAVPNDYEHNVCDLESHLGRMDRFLSNLARPDLAVLLALHPKSSRHTYQNIASKYGFHFADQPLTHVLPSADLFICSCSSSVLFAKLAAVPTINLDYLGVRDDDFRNVPGLVNVETAEDFAHELDRYGGGVGPTASKQIENYAAELARETLFDGHAGQRFCEFLLEIAQQRKIEAAA